jgi:chemotaxis protein CheD
MMMTAYAASTVPVGIGECVVRSRGQEHIVAHGLGSCLGISVYDPKSGTAAMLHALLPSTPQPGEVPTRYVETGIEYLVKELTRLNVPPAKAIWKMAGGARVLTIPGRDSFGIGARNVDAARQAFARYGLRVAADDVGGKTGRTMQLDVETGRVTVRMVGGVARDL